MLNVVFRDSIVVANGPVNIPNECFKVLLKKNNRSQRSLLGLRVIITVIFKKCERMSLTVQKITIDAASEGQRLDNFLIKTLKGVPQSHLYQIIRSGQLRVNKKRVKAQHRLFIGDEVRIPPIRVASASTNKDQAPWVPAKNFPILFEDEGLLIIDKPAGVAVHGGSGVAFGVIEQLRQARPQAAFLELVHRLDRETSGILFIAKRRSVLTHLQDQFRHRQLQKRYLTLVKGQWPTNLRLLDQFLYKYLTPSEERRVKVVDAQHPQAMKSITLIHRADHPNQPTTIGPISCLDVAIKTGRTHQIRVHLAHAGHPIAMDDKYGDESWNQQCQQRGLSRMFLHAWSVQFTHPLTQENLKIQCPLPDALTHWVLQLNSDFFNALPSAYFSCPEKSFSPKPLSS